MTREVTLYKRNGGHDPHHYRVATTTGDIATDDNTAPDQIVLWADDWGFRVTSAAAFREDYAVVPPPAWEVGKSYRHRTEYENGTVYTCHRVSKAGAAVVSWVESNDVLMCSRVDADSRKYHVEVES